MNATRLRLDRAALVALTAALFCGVLVTGCAHARREEPLVGQKTAPTGEAARGEKAFMRYCYQCHPGGAAGLGPALNNKPLPGTLIKTQVRMGGGAMPAMPKSRLSDEELDAVVVYLKWLRGIGS